MNNFSTLLTQQTVFTETSNRDRRKNNIRVILPYYLDLCVTNVIILNHVFKIKAGKDMSQSPRADIGAAFH